MNDHAPRHLDLCSGIGGFALAAQWAGFQTVAFSEIDEYANKVLKRHWPDVPNLGDIRTADISNPGFIDLLTAGIPCQPFSVAGKQKGNEDNRHLWPTVRQVIEGVRPTFVVIENVTGFISLALDDVQSDLENINYSSISFVIPACAVGADHRRDRVWVIAHTSSNRQQGIQRSVAPQIPQNRSFETLDAWHGLGSPFEHWRILMAESHVCRMADGVPSTVDVRPRLHAYGNAIVPQVAYVILKHIKELL